MTSAFSWQNCQRLPCFILYSKAKHVCYSRYLLSSYFCILIPYDEKDIFIWCQFQKVLQVFIVPFNFSFFGIRGWGIDLDYCDVEWFALETNRDHSVIFEILEYSNILNIQIIISGFLSAISLFIFQVLGLLFLCCFTAFQSF